MEAARKKLIDSVKEDWSNISDMLDAEHDRWMDREEYGGKPYRQHPFPSDATQDIIVKTAGTWYITRKGVRKEIVTCQKLSRSVLGAWLKAQATNTTKPQMITQYFNTYACCRKDIQSIIDIIPDNLADSGLNEFPSSAWPFPVHTGPPSPPPLNSKFKRLPNLNEFRGLGSASSGSPSPPPSPAAKTSVTKAPAGSGHRALPSSKDQTLAFGAVPSRAAPKSQSPAFRSQPNRAAPTSQGLDFGDIPHRPTPTSGATGRTSTLNKPSPSSQSPFLQLAPRSQPPPSNSVPTLNSSAPPTKRQAPNLSSTSKRPRPNSPPTSNPDWEKLRKFHQNQVNTAPQPGVVGKNFDFAAVPDFPVVTPELERQGYKVVRPWMEDERGGPEWYQTVIKTDTDGRRYQYTMMMRALD